jgi:HD superfamily phosphodiesterase
MNHPLIADLVEHPKVLETRDHMHHGVSKHDHLIRSVRYSYRIGRIIGADMRVVLRAALVHDIDSRLGTLTTHGAVAADWARGQGECERVCGAIVSHMYPFGPAPTSREGWVLTLADKAASLADLGAFVRGMFTGYTLREHRRLRQSDPHMARRMPRSMLRRLATRTRQRLNA